MKRGYLVKKILSTVKQIIVGLVVILAIAMMVFTIVSVNTFNRNDRTLMGYRVYIVASESMSADGLEAGDVILVEPVEPSTLKEGDIISYISQNSESYGETITHKIRSITTDASGDPGFITYGTTTNTDDETIVTYPFVLGKYKTSIPNIGNFFHFLKTPQGYFVCIFVPFMLLILDQGINCISLFRRYKKEQMEEVETEREKIQAERAENQKLMEELQALKEQLSKQQNETKQETVVENIEDESK